LLVEDTTIELNYGQRYGLLGRNGCGKSSFLKCLAEREVPIPEHLDVYLLEEEAKPEEVSALNYVINSAKAEHARLEALAEKLLVTEGPDSEALLEVYDRQSELDPDTMETRACTILVGLGFDAVPKPSGSSVHKLTRDMSGGWRMRVALARALFISPSILLLDEPTNHLDLDACVWLEDYLSTYPKLLVVVSHSQDFLNGVCTSMMVMQQKKLRYWVRAPTCPFPLFFLPFVCGHADARACPCVFTFSLPYVLTRTLLCSSARPTRALPSHPHPHPLLLQGGNFDQYCQTRGEQDKNQWTLYKKQQEEIAHIKEFIASCGTYANLVRQAKSREKQLNKMIEDGLIEKPFEDTLFRFKFPECGKLPPPLISFSDVSFSYSGRKQDYLFDKINFGIDCDSRVSLVGPNGAGKSTLLKLMVGENRPTEGSVSIKGGITIGRYHQHSAEVLDLEASPVEYISRKFQERLGEKKLEEWRSLVGTYGIPSEYHLQPIAHLSDGLKTRLVFCEISLLNPHILLLDEPTNAADMELIDSMAEAIQAFQGGLVVISHDFRLLAKVAKEMCSAGKFLEYSQHTVQKGFLDCDRLYQLIITLIIVQDLGASWPYPS